MPKTWTRASAPGALRTIYANAALGIRASVDALVLGIEAVLKGNGDRVEWRDDLSKARNRLVCIQRGVPEDGLAAEPDAAVVARFVKTLALLDAADISEEWPETPEATLGPFSAEFILLAASELGCRADTCGL